MRFINRKLAFHLIVIWSMYSVLNYTNDIINGLTYLCYVHKLAQSHRKTTLLETQGQHLVKYG